MFTFAVCKPPSLQEKQLTRSLCLNVHGVAQGVLIFLVISAIFHHRKSALIEPWSVLPLYLSSHSEHTLFLTLGEVPGMAAEQVRGSRAFLQVLTVFLQEMY